MTTHPPIGYPQQSPGDTRSAAPPSHSFSTAATQFGPSPSGQVPPPTPTDGRGHDWRTLAMALAAGVLAIVGVLVYVLGTSASAPARARLESALTATNSAVTANVTMSIKASIGGVSFGATASGTVDFATQAASLHMNLFGQTLAFIETDHVLYVKPGTLLGSKFPGKTWVRVPVEAMAHARNSQLFVTNDPAKAMSAFLKLGATVTPIGTVTIDGSQDQGYRIDLTLASLEAHASELPPSFRSLFATAKDAPRTAAVSTTMYVDPAGQLQAAHVAVTAEETGRPVTATVDLTMSNFGAPSAPASPPTTQTVTYQQLQGSLGSGALPFTLPSGAQATT